MKRLGTILASFGIAACINAQTATNTIDVNTSKLGASIQPTMYGIFFEDINFAADGGLYAELIRNRSFEDSSNYDYWTKEAPSGTRVSITNITSGLLNKAQKHALKMTVTDASEQLPAGISNEGYWGINAVEGRT